LKFTVLFGLTANSKQVDLGIGEMPRSEELVALFLEYFQARCFHSKYSEAGNFLLTLFIEGNEREYDPRGMTLLL